MRILALLLTLGLVGCGTGPKPPAAPAPPQQSPPPTPPPPVLGPRYEAVPWSQVEGWSEDQQQDAWGAFMQGCRARDLSLQWAGICADAQGRGIATAVAARDFFEARFTAYRLLDVQSGGANEIGLITGYYEPLLQGARKRSKIFNVPLYSPPDDMLTIELGELYPELKGRRIRGRLQGRKVVPYFDRAEIAARPVLRGHELLWVDDAMDAFFLEVQGSGRVQLRDGKTVRVVYADQNGQPYRAIGRYLVEIGALPLEGISLQSIRQWLEANPQRMQEVLNANPSVVFFREERIDDPAQGPKGSLGVPLTAGRSIAVDPQFVPLGAPVFLATTYPDTTLPMNRLVLAQDTGGAIRGLVRADLFWGFGASAEQSAGKMKQPGRLWLLWPTSAGEPKPADF